MEQGRRSVPSLSGLLLGLVVILPLGAQDLPTTTLVPSSTIETAVPGFGFWGTAQCDDKGNLYFHAAAGLNDTAILRLEADGSSQTFYTLPLDAAKEVVFTAFQADRDGSLWLLAQERSTARFSLFSFSKDSNRAPTQIQLAAPTNLAVQNFVMLPQDHVLLLGYFSNKAEPAWRGRRYEAEFDAAGRVIRELGLRTEDVNLAEVAHQFGEGAAVTRGDDGLIYLLHSKEILVLLPSGGVKTRFPLAKPANDYFATNISVSAGRIAVRLIKLDGPSSFATRYLLVDAATGKAIKLYAPSDELGNNAVCFSARNGFTFFRVENRRVKLVTAKAQ